MAGRDATALLLLAGSFWGIDCRAGINGSFGGSLGTCRCSGSPPYIAAQAVLYWVAGGGLSPCTGSCSGSSSGGGWWGPSPSPGSSLATGSCSGGSSRGGWWRLLAGPWAAAHGAHQGVGGGGCHQAVPWPQAATLEVHHEMGGGGGCLWTGTWSHTVAHGVQGWVVGPVNGQFSGHRKLL